MVVVALTSAVTLGLRAAGELAAAAMHRLLEALVAPDRPTQVVAGAVAVMMAPPDRALLAVLASLFYAAQSLRHPRPEGQT